MAWLVLIAFFALSALCDWDSFWQRRRQKDAYRFNKPNIHGVRKVITSNKDLKKGGLL